MEHSIPTLTLLFLFVPMPILILLSIITMFKRKEV